ncbi:MAG: hypothetical protein ACREOI_13235 [bacterium]
MSKPFCKKNVLFGLLIALAASFGCAEEKDYHQQAKEFYAQYDKSREADLLFHYQIKRRNEGLYLQTCQRAPEDSVKIWAFYGGDNLEYIEIAKLKIAVTPFPDLATGKRVIPEYEPVHEADTTGTRRELILRLREVIHAFHRLGLQEVICASDVTYLVQKEFMMVYIPEAAQAPASVTNIATKLDENWYYEISLEHQQEQRLRLINVLREFLDSTKTQQADTTNKELAP